MRESFAHHAVLVNGPARKMRSGTIQACSDLVLISALCDLSVHVNAPRFIYLKSGEVRSDHKWSPEPHVEMHFKCELTDSVASWEL